MPVLDAKLADYAFFPLSYVMRDAAVIPAKALSIALQCLEIMIRRGWKTEADSALTREFLVFLTIQLSKNQQDDLLLALLACTETFVQYMASGISELCTKASKENSAVTGQLIDNLLRIIKDSPANEIQVAAARILKSFISLLKDRSLLRMFLPGIASQLSNVLRPPVKRTYRVLSMTITTLEVLAQATLSDQSLENETTDEDKSWRKATSTQLLVALSTIIPLRYHERIEVLDALTTLCMTVLDDCGMALENCRSIMLETLCAIGSQAEPNARVALQRLVVDNAIYSSLQESMFKWLRALPRKLESQDTQAAERYVALICEGYRALRESAVDIMGLERELKQAIWDSARGLLEVSKRPSPVDQLPDLSVRDLTLGGSIAQFKAPNPFNSSQLNMLEKLFNAAPGLTKIEDGNEYIDDSGLASMWVLTRSLSNQIQADIILQDFVIDATAPVHLLDVALNRALEVLTDDAEDLDYRAQALALELITLVAQQEKEGFQTSLVDTLFPMVELLGTSNSILRQCAIVALNNVSNSCGYSGTGDMIVRNGDYLVNAIALKFNTFDVSPQAGQVLVMMLELSGPALIPYLDDLIDSIFGALAAYHGYPRLVEVMFSALAAIVKHGSSNSSSIMNRASIKHTKQIPILLQVSAVPAILDDLRKPRRQNEEEEMDMSSGDAKTALQPTETPPSETDTPEKPPKVYTMVESVVRLSQHYLTHQEPYLRQRLLELVSIGCTSLSRNEEQFLPLINDIWPVVIRRLYDGEAVVVLAAMQALIAIFHGAGDFVSTRIQDEWSHIKSFFYSCEAKAKAERKGTGGRGMFAYTERIFEGMVDMLVELIFHVRVTLDIEDDLFAMLGPLASKKGNVRDALEVLNADALWLILEANDFDLPKPVVDGFTFADIHVV